MTFSLTNKRKIQFTVYTAICVLVMCITACSKKDANANAKFIGTYAGNNCAGIAVANVVVTAGASGSLISVAVPAGTGGCALDIQLIGTVSGNNVMFSSQQFNDLCGNEVTVSGTGTLSGNTFTINLSGLNDLSGSSGSSTAYCFTGSK